MTRNPYALGLVAALAGLSIPCPSTTHQSRDSWTELADALVERMALDSGERVLLLGVRGSFDSLIAPLRAAVRAVGAVDLGALDVHGQPLGSDDTPFVKGAAGLGREQLRRYFADVDIGVMLPGATAADVPYAAMQDVLRTGRGRTIHFHWAGAYDLVGRLLSNTQDIDALYQKVVFETDYSALAEHQRRLEGAMRSGEVRVTTPLGTDLRFRIGNRPVTRQDGDASSRRAAVARNLIDREVEIPAGAVRVAPLEDTVEGVIAFPPSTWHGVSVVGLVLEFENGRIVSMHAQTGLSAVTSELETGGESARRFREFALGLNPLLEVPRSGAPWIPYYGYGAGVVRLSLGDNTELGGEVAGGYVRWNFFTDATVTVGGEVWVRDGRLITAPDR